MPISYIPKSNSRRCSDPNLYSLQNIPDYHLQAKKNCIYLPPLHTTNNKKEQQFTDTSCQERSIMIDKLIETSAEIIDSIWSKKKVTNAKVMPTAQFIREILKRSRATYSMLQLALFYIFRIKKLIFESFQQPNQPYHELICCGRRMFLAALMASSKYLNDKNYKNKTWSRVASLSILEINATEMIFLRLIDYQLYVSKPLYDKWVSLLHDHIQKKHYFYKMKQEYCITADTLHYINHPTYSPHRPHHVFNNPHTTTSELSPPQSCSSSTSSICSSPNSDTHSMASTPPLVYGIKRPHPSTPQDTMNKKHFRPS